MKFKTSHLFYVFFTLLGLESLVWAQDTGSEKPAQKKSDKNKKDLFKQSKFTSDQSESETDKRSLLLSTFETKIVDLDFEPDATNPPLVVNNKVVVVTVVKIGDKRQLVFSPIGEGSTTVLIRDETGNAKVMFNVRVNEASLNRITEELKTLLKEVEGINLKILGDKIVLDGELLTPNDFARVNAVLEDPAYSKTVMNLTTISPITLQFLAKKIEDDIKSFAEKVTTRVINGQILIEGSVPDRKYAIRASRVAELYMPNPRPPTMIERDSTAVRMNTRSALIQNLLIVDPPAPKKQERLVRVTMHFVELTKDYSKIFGFKWAPGFTLGDAATGAPTLGLNFTGSSPSNGTSLSATISNLLPKLNSAQEAGFARILKTSNLIVRSGQAGQLTDTNSIPVIAYNPNGQPVSAKEEVGLSMSITPTILGESEDIQVDLNIKQQNVVGRTTAGILTSKHEVTTKLYIKSSESAAVAGVEGSDVSTQFNKDDPKPGSFDGGGSGGAPTDSIFSLLRTKAYVKRKGQFVIFVTPQIVNDASQGNEDMKKNLRIKVN